MFSALAIVDPVKRAEAIQKALLDMLELTGAPVSTTKRWTENVQKVIDGDYENLGEAVLRLLNFSEYQISGPRKTTKTKLITPSTDTDLVLDLDLDLDLDLELDEIFD